MAEKIRSREEIAREDTWAMEDLYTSDEAWMQDLEKLKGLGAKLPEYAGKLAKSAQTLLEYQKLGEEISVLLDSLANYAQRKSDEDTKKRRLSGPDRQAHKGLGAARGGYGL